MLRTNISPFFVILLIICIPVVSIAQPNEIIDRLLEEEEASSGKAVFIVISAAGLLEGEVDESEILPLLQESGYTHLPESPEEPIRLGELSHIIIRSFGMKGGLMYTLFPGPRYASRELLFKRIITRNADSYRKPSGEEVLRILGRVLSWKEEQS